MKIILAFLLLFLGATTALAATPSLIFLPDQEVFPPLAVGASGPSQTVTIQLSQTGTLTLSGVTATSGFSAQLGCGSDLPPGILCPIAVTFVPSAPGLQQGSINVAYTSSAAATQSKTVCGTGLPAANDFAIGFVFDCTASTSGATSVIGLAVYPNSFNGTVNLSCTAAGSAPCSVSPTSVTLAGSAPVNFTVNATLAASNVRPLFGTPARTIGMVGLACIVLVFGFSHGRRRARLGLLLFGLSAAFFAGCGGSSSTNGPASSQITIIAAGSNGTTHQSTFNLKPQ
jgi:hypothetical protein